MPTYSAVVRILAAYTVIAVSTACSKSATEPAWLTEAMAGEFSDPDAAIDAAWARIARDTPGGFAGIYSEPGGTRGGGTVVRLTDLTRWEAARRSLEAHPDYEALQGADLNNARVERARWNYAELFVARQYVTRQLPLFSTGFSGIGIDVERNRVLIAVPEERVPEIHARLQELLVPDDLVEVVAGSLCSDEIVPSLRIFVRDSSSGADLLPGSTISVSGPGDFSFTYIGSVESERPLPVAEGRRGGRFHVVVRRSGYRDWRSSSIEVGDDGCQVRTVDVTARLQAAP